MNITFEERQLMSLYNTGTRTGLIAALEEMRGYRRAELHQDHHQRQDAEGRGADHQGKHSESQ